MHALEPSRSFRPAPNTPLFASWLMGGFESATLLFGDGRRVDAIDAVGHDRLAYDDYMMLREHGILTVRDSLRWHLIEKRPYVYDWSSFLPMLAASRKAGVQVIWDLCHFGIPQDIDPWSSDFVHRFAAFSQEAARIVAAECDDVPFWAPVNEISFWSYAGGEHSHFAPYGYARGLEWKRQLSRAAIASIHRLRQVDDRARIVHTDPVIHVIALELTPDAIAMAENRRRSMFDAWDRIAGFADPELGGSLECLDIVGVNFYPSNQFTTDEKSVGFGQLFYRPFVDILTEVWDRYRRPIVISETGAEGPSGAAWMHHIHRECMDALDRGIPIEGICTYPIMDYVGWSDDRHCRCGLIKLDDAYERRSIDGLMAAAFRQYARRPTLQSRHGI